MLSTYQRPPGPWMTKKFGWRVTVPFVSAARTTRWLSAPAVSLTMRYESALKKHWRMISRFSSSFHWMLSRAAPLFVPNTTDIAWRSPACAASRNCVTARRGAAAPVIPPEFTGPGVVLPGFVRGADAQAATNIITGNAFQFANRFSTVNAFQMGRRVCV
jgi:hypothetical protein